MRGGAALPTIQTLATLRESSMNTPASIQSQVSRMFSAAKRKCLRRPGRVVLLGCLLSAGCASRQAWRETVGNDTSRVDCIAAKVDNPEAEIYETSYTAEPWTPFKKEDYANILYKDVELQHVLGIAMANSKVLRDLGGTVLRNPDVVKTDFTGGLQEMDPRFGTEAALSAFDAQFKSTANFANNDRTYNNSFFAGGTNTFVQDANDYTNELSKLNATGSRMAFRNVTNYDNNNAPGNLFPNAWDNYLEGELRQPLLQGGGVQFNRIAGPGNAPGVYNGILIAKVGTDINQVDFEMAVRDYVSDVVNAYWDLYLAYRQLEAKTVAMNEALKTWKTLENDPDDDDIRIALAKEQYFRFKADVDEAISGRIVQGTQGRNGSTGGTVRGVDGVQVAERRLRLLIGLPIADGEMLRPLDEPEQAKMIFDWSSVTDEAMMGRPELRKQQLKVRQREMELLAARNFLNPRLDAVGRYRFRGFGDDLVAYDGSNAVGNMMAGKNQEWFVGAEFNIPIGYRKAHAAVSHAELMVSRERAVHREQQKAVVHDVMNAVGESERAFEACENSMNRFRAAEVVVKAMLQRDEVGDKIDPDRLFDAQRRVVEAKVEFFRARVEYAVAVKNVHLEKNSLMAYNNLQIYDGAVPLAVTSDTAGEEQLYQDQSKPLQSVPEEPPEADAEAEVPKSAAFEAEQDFELGEVSPVSLEESEYSEQELNDDEAMEVMPDQMVEQLEQLEQTGEQAEINDLGEELLLDQEFTGE
jgi:hypothetical protein